MVPTNVKMSRWCRTRSQCCSPAPPLSTCTWALSPWTDRPSECRDFRLCSAARGETRAETCVAATCRFSSCTCSLLRSRGRSASSVAVTDAGDRWLAVKALWWPASRCSSLYPAPALSLYYVVDFGIVHPPGWCTFFCLYPWTAHLRLWDRKIRYIRARKSNGWNTIAVLPIAMSITSSSKSVCPRSNAR